jgi:hypothetical protein
MKLPKLHSLFQINGRIVVNDKLGRMWKEIAEVYCAINSEMFWRV